MDRLKQWMGSGSFDGPSGSSGLRERSASETYTPPALIQTTNTFDDDESFSTVSLNLLSRFQMLGLSAEEAIVSVLIYPCQRSSFLEALCARKRHALHSSPTSASLINNIDRSFGLALRNLVARDVCAGDAGLHHPCIRLQQSHDMPPPSTPRLGNTTTRHKPHRSFFPDSGTGSFLGGGVVSHAMNMDCLSKQVQSLCLDGTSSRVGNIGRYDPPTPLSRMPM